LTLLESWKAYTTSFKEPLPGDPAIYMYSNLPTKFTENPDSIFDIAIWSTINYKKKNRRM